MANMNTITRDIGERAIGAYVDELEKITGRHVNLLVPFESVNFYQRIGRRIFRLFTHAVDGKCAHICWFYNSGVPKKQCCNFRLADEGRPGPNCPLMMD